MKLTKVKIKLQKNGIMPTRSSEGAIGYDLYIPCDTQVYEGRNVIPLNFALEMVPGIEAKIEPRSGMASRGMSGQSLPDYFGKFYSSRYDADVLVGKIDPDYRGTVGVIINNHDASFILPKGTRVAQMSFYQVELPTFEIVDELSTTERGECGFGSTGVITDTPPKKGEHKKGFLLLDELQQFEALLREHGYTDKTSHIDNEDITWEKSIKIDESTALIYVQIYECTTQNMPKHYSVDLLLSVGVNNRVDTYITLRDFDFNNIESIEKTATSLRQ